MGQRKARNTDYFFVLNALGIARESVTIILRHLFFFASIAVLFLCPVSVALFLSRALLPNSLLVAKFALQIRAVGLAAGFPNSSYTHIICNKLSETIICYALCFPFVVTFSLFARAAVVYTVARVYAGNKPSFQKLLEAIPNSWKRLVVTYLWAGAILLVTNTAIFVLVSGVIRSVHVVFSWNWEIGAALVGGVVYSIVFAHAMILFNLSWVVSVMEEGNYGMEAVLRAMFLIRGRTRIALVMAVIVNLNWAFVEGLFEYRAVGGRNGRTDFGNMAWEGSLLVFMYSVVTVMDGVMSTVFYYSCKSSRLESVCPGSCSSSTICFLNPWQSSCLCDQQSFKKKLTSEYNV